MTETDWTKDDAEVPGDNTHLWEESWDDDDTSEDFSAQLKFVIFHSNPLELLPSRSPLASNTAILSGLPHCVYYVLYLEI